MKGCQQFPRTLNILLLVSGGVCVVSTGKLYIVARKLEVLGPAGFPFVVSAIGVVLVAAIVVFGLFVPEEIHSPEIDFRDVRTIRIFLVIILTALYIATVGQIGFVVASIIYQTVLTITFGAIKKTYAVVALIVSILSVGSIYLVFTSVFKLPLPGAF